MLLLIGASMLVCLGGIAFVGRENLRLQWALWCVKGNAKVMVIPGIETLGRAQYREALPDIIDAWERLGEKTWWDEECERITTYAIANMGKASIPLLVDMLGDRQVETRRRAIACLYVIAGEAGFEWWIVKPALEDRDAVVRGSALQCLEKLGTEGEGAIDMVVPMLSDNELFIRHSALRAYGSIAGNKFTRSIVEEMIKDSEEPVRRLALEILGEHAAGTERE